jgi:hypothetical protein
MQDAFRLAILALWIVWLIYWYASARNVKATRWRASIASRALYRVPALLTGVLMIRSPSWLSQVLDEKFLPATLTTVMAGIIAVAVGLGFTFWARRHLGRNWSSCRGEYAEFDPSALLAAIKSRGEAEILQQTGHEKTPTIEVRSTGVGLSRCALGATGCDWAVRSDGRHSSFVAPLQGGHERISPSSAGIYRIRPCLETVTATPCFEGTLTCNSAFASFVSVAYSKTYWALVRS